MGGCSACARVTPAQPSRPSARGAGHHPPGRQQGRCAPRDRDYVVVTASATSRREKSVVLTLRGIEYLEEQRAAARAIEVELRAAVGEAGFAALLALLDALDDGWSEGMRTYLQRSTTA